MTAHREETFETVSEPIQNALYATGNFTTDQCSQLTDGILMYLKDAGFKISSIQPPTPISEEELDWDKITKEHYEWFKTFRRTPNAEDHLLWFKETISQKIRLREAELLQRVKELEDALKEGLHLWAIGNDYRRCSDFIEKAKSLTNEKTA